MRRVSIEKHPRLLVERGKYYWQWGNGRRTEMTHLRDADGKAFIPVKDKTQDKMVRLYV